jgi:hypothetical protein
MHSNWRCLAMLAALTILTTWLLGCSWKVIPVTAETVLSEPSGLGIAIGRFDAGPTVGTVDAPPEDPVVVQYIRQVVDGWTEGPKRKLPLAEAELASDFHMVLPAGRYRLVEGSADTGYPDGHSLRTAEWTDTGLEFEVTAGQVGCVGEYVGTRGRGLGGLLLAVLTRGGASYSFESRDSCDVILERFRSAYPELEGAPTP